MQTAVNALVQQRLRQMVSGGYDFADTLHNVYLDFGYPVGLEFSHFWNMYRRFGIARRVVSVKPEYTWRDEPTIEGPEPFVKAWDALQERLGIYRVLRSLDKRQRVGKYAALVMRVRDGKSPEMPIGGKLPGEAALVDILPLYESQLEPSETQSNLAADDYGQPLMYTLITGAVGNRNAQTSASASIHPSRVITVSEEADSSSIYGVSVLEAPYNSLLDARKIIGAGGEGFYRNAAQSLLFNLQDPSTVRTSGDLLTKFNEQFDDFTRNRMRRGFWTPGMEAKELQSNLSDPTGPFQIAMDDIAAACDTPKQLLIGMQTGRLAGDQDTEQFLSSIQSRRLNWATDMIERLIDWCIEYGVLPAADYKVEWPDALAPSKKEMIDNAKKLSEINQVQILTGAMPAFSSEEIRDAAGYDSDDLPNIGVGDRLPSDPGGDPTDPEDRRQPTTEGGDS